jgi:hypothetical protein
MGRRRVLFFLTQERTQNYATFNFRDQYDAKLPRKCFQKPKCTCKTSSFSKHIPKPIPKECKKNFFV